MKHMHSLFAFVLMLFISACGGGGGGAAPASSGAQGVAVNYAVGGILKGLAAGNSITVTNTFGSSQNLTADGPFSFAGTQSDGSSYAVSLTSLPANQPCTSTYGAGNLNGGDVVANVICGMLPRGSFSSAARLTTARSYFTATRLLSGKMLVVGGTSSNLSLASAELYDPVNDTWTTAASLATSRYSHTSTLLPDGKVLVVGGFSNQMLGVNGLAHLFSAEIYDPVTDSWATVASMTTARRSHSATLLQNGKVLVTGGYNDLYTIALNTMGYSPGVLANSEIYDPASNTWATSASLPTSRQDHTATLLQNGKVLVTGGYNLTPGVTGANYLSSRELYDPATNSWAATGSFATARISYVTTLLSDGKVLVTGGRDNAPSSPYLASCELYDPTTDSWIETASRATASSYTATATLLQSGKVLVTNIGSGIPGTGFSSTSSELYDPITNTWSAAAISANGFTRFTTTLLSNGHVLMVDWSGSAELYDPAISSWSAPSQPTAARDSPTATLLPNGRVLLVGFNSLYAQSNYSRGEFYDSIANTWSVTGGFSISAIGPYHYNHTATLLPSGKVLVAGGTGSEVGNSINVTLSGTELWDPVTNTWSGAGWLRTARQNPTATLLPNGKVLLVGGGIDDRLNSNTSNQYVISTVSAELYDPAASTIFSAWTAAGNLTLSRMYHTATLLPNGKVLVVGGLQVKAGGNSSNLNTNISSAELYDPASNTWASAGNLATARYNHSATLLPNGKVLVTGGQNGAVIHASSELYDPATNTWTSAGGLINARSAHAATLLPNGKVMVAGGYSLTTGLVNFYTTGQLDGVPMMSVELYDPATNVWSSAKSLANARYSFAATLLTNGALMVAGGKNGTTVPAPVELYW